MNKQVKRKMVAGAILGSVLLMPSVVHADRDAKDYCFQIPVEDDEALKDIYLSYYNLLEENGYSYEVMNDRGFACEEVLIHEKPEVDSSIVGLILKNDDCSLVASCNEDWYAVHYGTSFGFVSKKSIEKINERQLAVELETLPEVVRVVRATDTVNVRADSSVDSPSYGLLEIGEALPYVGITKDDWYQVEYNGNIGYISGKHAKLGYAISGDFYRIASMNEDAPLCQEPYGEIKGTIPKHEAVMIYGDASNYFFVESNGEVGYVPKSYCEMLMGTYAIVDISDQRLDVYQGNKKVLSSPVVTGKDSTPSDIGLFEINTMQRDVNLVGDDYDVNVDYWMHYYDGEGLHDASWRDSFGGNIYHDGGSHGCINLPTEVASKVYSYMNVGDKVLVKK